MIWISGKREVEAEQEVDNLLGGRGQWKFLTGGEGIIKMVIGECRLLLGCMWGFCRTCYGSMVREGMACH